MNNEATVAFATLTVPAGVFLLLPLLTPRGYFFGVPVEPDFKAMKSASEIVRVYRTMVAVSYAVALGLAVSSPSLLPLAIVVLGAVGVVAFFRARHQAQAYAAPRPSVLDSMGDAAHQRLPGWMLLGLLPLAVPLAVAYHLHQQWAWIPARFPVHWGIDGQPNRWAEKTAHGVYGPLWFGVLMILFLLVMAVAGFYGSRPSPMRVAMLRVILAAACFVAFLFGMVGMLPLHHYSPWLWIAPAVALFGVLIVQLVRTASNPDFTSEATPDECWKLSSVYYNRADPALFVQRRIGVGYTLNFGQPMAWVLLLMIVGLIPAAIWLMG
ncbi:MAG TPA: DUF5808 domain-containing protein [Bryobacteraceae bacterium]|jgi:uncharacterized membrane protein|nr:DUF5808 domain-containing protein [Bryobacteraceae bacterium]